MSYRQTVVPQRMNKKEISMNHRKFDIERCKRIMEISLAEEETSLRAIL